MNALKILRNNLQLPKSIAVQKPVTSLLNEQTRMSSTKPKMTSIKHLRPGSVCPPGEKDFLRVYNMRFCPFAQRTLLVLHAKGFTDFEIVNVHLKNKPDWFLQKNPLGKVPVLELNGKTIPESVVTSECIDTMFPDPPLFPSDPYLKHVDKGFIAKFDNLVANVAMRFFFLSHVTEKFKKWGELLSSGLQLFEDELKSRGTPYFGGSKPGMLDYMIWPWFERMSSFNYAAKMEFIPEEKFPCLTKFQSKMLEDKAVQATIISEGEHRYFASSLMKGQPDYDMEHASKL